MYRDGNGTQEKVGKRFKGNLAIRKDCVSVIFQNLQKNVYFNYFCE